MLEKIMSALDFAFRQQDAVYRIGRMAKGVFKNGFSFKKIIAVIVAFFEMFGSVIFDAPLTPAGQELNLDGYNLVFCDEFESSALNTAVWEFRHLGKDSGGFNDVSQAKVKDGNLYITGEYKENGTYGSGWYAADLQLKKLYKQGYFEIRCICNKGDDFWSAFWIQADHPYDHALSNGGIGGAELDIFESITKYNSKPFMKNAVTNTVHCNGGDEDEENIDSRCIGKFKGKNIHEEYNTYGLEWTDSEYIFYINGVETGRTSFSKGVSQVEEHICVSLCMSGEINMNQDEKSIFTVDYVKIWQK